MCAPHPSPYVKPALYRNIYYIVSNISNDAILVQNTQRESTKDDSDNFSEDSDLADETYIPEEESTGSSIYEASFFVGASNTDVPRTVQEAL